MALYALEDLDDALDATIAFIRQLDIPAWVKLAVIALFIGGPTGNLPGFQSDVPMRDFQLDFRPPPPGDLLGAFDLRTAVAVALIGTVLLVLVLLLVLVGSIMEFLLIETLRTNTVSLREYWHERWRQGVRLFAFRVGLGLLTLFAFAITGLVGVLPFLVGAPGYSIITFIAVFPVFLVLAILAGVINGFTTVFVVPIMIIEEVGILAGWRRLWRTITSAWQEFLAYAIAGFVLSIAAGILTGIGLVIAGILLLIPWGILGGIGFVLMGVLEPIGILVIAIAAIMFTASILLALGLIQVPILTYLRFYALLILGDVDGSLDLIPAQRETIRESTE